jgi:hypothetical protein
MIQVVNAYGALPHHVFRLDETSGSTAYDRGRRRTTASIPAGFTLNQTGPDGRKCVKSSGTGANSSTDATQSIQVVGADALNIDGHNFSFSFRVKFGTITNNVQYLFTKGTYTSPGTVIDCYHGPTGGGVLGVSVGGVSNVEGSYAFNTTDWYTIAFTFDKVLLQGTIYVNGVQLAQGTYASGYAGTNGTPWYLGGRYHNTWGLNMGYICDVQLWDFVLHPVEVENVAAHGNVIGMQRALLGDPYPVVLWNKLGSVAEVTSSEVGPPGVITGTYTFGVAKFNTGPIQNADTQRLTFANVFQQIRDRGTLSIWWKPAWTGNPGTTRYVMSQDGSDEAQFDWQIGSASGGSWSVTVGGVSISYVWTPTSGTLYHLVVVYDKLGIDGSAHTLRFYINGSLVASSTSAFTTLTTVNALKIGVRGLTNLNNGNCTYDNLIVYSYAKTDFSDNTQERPGISFSSIIQVLDKRLTFWNRLSSAQDITNSKLGVNMVNGLTTKTYVTGPTGMQGGVRIPASDASLATNILFNGQLVLSSEGCLEIWMKPDAWTCTGTTVSDGITHSVIGIDAPLSYGFTFQLYVVSGSGFWLECYGNYNGSPNYYEYRTIPVTFTIDWFHLAVVWSKVANSFAVYINNVLQGTKADWASVLSNCTIDSRGSKFGLGVTNFGPGGWTDRKWNGWMSNAKIHNWAKTDFSDRFVDAPINLLEVDV